MRAEGMSPLLALGLLVAGLCSSVHCLPGGGLDPEDVTPEDQHKGVPVDDHTFVSSNTDFAFSLYKQLALKTPNENVIFSPPSISMALAFLSLGARGPTLTEILEGLKFNFTKTPETEIHQGFQHLLQMLGRPSHQLQLSVGNAMFVQEQLKLLDKFREDARALCASEAFSTDFRGSDTAKKLINDYVRNKTQGKIVELFKDLDKLTNIVLVNYIFFKARWKKPFDPSRTYKSELHVSENRTVEVPMKTTGGLETPYFPDELRACTVVELKCTRNDTTPLILPDEAEMQDLEAELLPETLRRWRDSLQPRRIDELNLPRFSISSDYELRNILSQLGIKKVFNHESDLSGIIEANKLGVSEVIYKAVVEMAEEHTETAATMGIKIHFSARRT
ncbi:serpin A3-8-like [Balaenoptera musculus]|uniref:Serpin A3-8-like n=1 Tax=Balaenoptera musculus TaxID=9771 RepID=A0A8B8WTW3_BALMU|nr:serpin A3-8-like [Balaenoptera musculus]